MNPAKLPRLNLPAFNLKIDDERIYDPIRKKWVALTPEEWVRQNFVAYLLQHKKYPRSLIKIENTITAFGASRRCDAVIFSNEIQPLLIIECKAPMIPIRKKTFEQIALYNSTLHTPYLIVTNGMDHYCLKINYKSGKSTFLQDIPTYDEISR